MAACKQQRLALSAGTNACALSLEAALFALLLQKDLPFALACVIIISVSHGAALALCTAFYALVLVMGLALVFVRSVVFELVPVLSLWVWCWL